MAGIGCEAPVAVPSEGETEDGSSGGDEDTTATGDMPETPDGEQTSAPPVDPPVETCGDGVRNGDEECDGEDLGGATCEDLGAFAGDLACRSDCTFEDCDCDWGEGPSCDPPMCGNGVAEAGEACDGNDIPRARDLHDPPLATRATVG